VDTRGWNVELQRDPKSTGSVWPQNREGSLVAAAKSASQFKLGLPAGYHFTDDQLHMAIKEKYPN
jgi:hypothetical protein